MTDDDDQAAALADRLAAGDAAVTALERVEALHRMTIHRGGPICAYCTTTWPCRTRRAIDGAGDGGERHG